MIIANNALNLPAGWQVFDNAEQPHRTGEIDPTSQLHHFIAGGLFGVGKIGKHAFGRPAQIDREIKRIALIKPQFGHDQMARQAGQLGSTSLGD